MFFSVVPSEEGGGVGNLSPSPAAPVEVDIFVEKSRFMLFEGEKT